MRCGGTTGALTVDNEGCRPGLLAQCAGGGCCGHCLYYGDTQRPLQDAGGT